MVRYLIKTITQDFIRERLRAGARVLVVIYILTLLIPLSAHSEKTRIGVSLPITGPASTYGQDIKNVLEFANSKLGDRYELIFEDDRCSPKEGLTIANKFASELKLKYITGYACSSALLASAPIYEKAKILTVALISTSKNVTNAGDYIFRTYPSTEITSRILAEEIFKKHDSLGVLSEQTEYAQSFLSGIRQAAGNHSVENVDYLPQDSDLRSLILKLRLKKVPALFINPQTESSFIAVLQQLRQLQWAVPIYSAFYAGSQIIIKDHSDLVQGINLLDTEWPDDCENCSQLYQEFKSEKGGMKSMESVFLSAYNGFNALDQAIQTGGKNPKEFLYNTRFDGITGPWSFDKNGDVQAFKFVIKVIR